MADLNLSIDYLEHPKTKRLIASLGIGSEIYPIRLWIFAAKFFRETGRLMGYTAEEIDGVIGFTQAGQEMFSKVKPGHCTLEMARIGFLDFKRGVYGIHDWKEHAGHLIAFEVRAKSAAKERWRRYRDNATSNATSNAKTPVEQCLNPPTQPSKPTIPTQPTGSGVAGNGNGEMREGKGGGNLVHSLNKNGDEFERMSEVKKILEPLILDAKARASFVARRDVTPPKLRRLIEDIQRDPNVGDLGAVLRDRLNGARQ